MSRKKICKALLHLLITLVIAAAGFILGRQHYEKGTTTVITHYIQLPAIHDTIIVKEPKYVKLPTDTAKIIQQCINDGIYTELFPEKIVEKEIFLTSEDTLAIVIDWASERTYSETIIDNDTIGRIDIEANVQYNRLKSIEYDLKLYQKETNTITNKKPMFEPFLGASVLTNGNGMVELGTFVRQNVGMSLIYDRDMTNNKNAFGIGIKLKI